VAAAFRVPDPARRLAGVRLRPDVRVAGPLDFRRHGDRLVIVHTGVPEALEGQGIGGELVRAALELAEADHLTVVPRCPFARQWLEDHPDDAARVPVDWGTKPAGDGWAD